MLKKKYVQVEITRNCSEKCIVCPHRKWKFGGEMDFKDFLKISKCFSDFEIVYLQGWGEPLQHRKFFEMLKIAKTKAKTGFTTNGKKLKKYAEKVAELTDYLLVSFGGVNIHDETRGVKFDEAFEGLRAVAEAKKETGSSVRIGASYMLTTQNWMECTEFVKIIGGVADYVVFTNLDYVFDEITEELRLFGKNIPEASNEVERALNLARKAGMKARAYPLHLEEQAVCEANPHLSMAISCECEIYPCIYLCLPFEKIERIFSGKKIYAEKPYFGTLSKDALEKYEKFISVFRKRISAYERALDELFTSSPFTALRKLSAVDDALARNPPPECCKTCYKLYGV